MSETTATNPVLRCKKCLSIMAFMQKWKDGYNGFKCFKCNIVLKNLKARAEDE